VNGASDAPPATIPGPDGPVRIADISRVPGVERLPYVSRIFLENVLRHGGKSVDAELAFYPGRVLMHDTTCGPALVDIAAARSALAAAGQDPERLNPVLRVDVSTDHSVAVDVFGHPGAKTLNIRREFTRNHERYRFMKWATSSLTNLTVHPPGAGIMHTINLERLATVVSTEVRDGQVWALPDTLVGTDSHTPMINGLGVLAWGVGGLEAESVMLGMPVIMRRPEVVGVRLTGRLSEGVLATDLALHVTSVLRARNVGGRFVEFFGPGVSTLSVGERAVVANMAPEYGAACGYFPIDGAVLAYLAATGRSAAQADFVERYARRQALWFDPQAEPDYAEVVDFDLSAVRISLAGPQRPQDLLSPAEAGGSLARLRGTEQAPQAPVAIAAITSCTNTSDPRLLVAAGLLARKARGFGLAPPDWVKTSLAPGSPTAERYLQRTGLLEDLEALGFAIVGYGCTTCIGNSGGLLPAMTEALEGPGVLPVAVLSGNRNFPGRVHPDLEAAFLASPPLVVAYALAGEANRDIQTDPIGRTTAGDPVYLADIWPSGAEIDDALAGAVLPGDYDAAYDAAAASRAWAELQAPSAPLYPWEAGSTYLRPPPFAAAKGEPRLSHYLAHPLIVLGDDITTDHISPAGAVRADSDAGRYLIERGENPADLNVFSARRGNWEAMVRGLFTNRSVRNLLGANIPAGRTIHAPSGEELSLWDAAERYRAEAAPVVMLAGERYGMGSSRDWAAKGPALLGVRAVLAASFERIHRSNLVNMGVLPLRLPPEQHPARLELAPGDRIEVDARPGILRPRKEVRVAVHRADGRIEVFFARAEIETGLELDVLKAGGMIPMILQRMLAADPQPAA
jgi:aconitate hydratase